MVTRHDTTSTTECIDGSDNRRTDGQTDRQTSMATTTTTQLKIYKFACYTWNFCCCRCCCICLVVADFVVVAFFCFINLWMVATFVFVIIAVVISRINNNNKQHQAIAAAAAATTRWQVDLMNCSSRKKLSCSLTDWLVGWLLVCLLGAIVVYLFNFASMISRAAMNLLTFTFRGGKSDFGIICRQTRVASKQTRPKEQKNQINALFV